MKILLIVAAAFLLTFTASDVMAAEENPEPPREWCVNQDNGWRVCYRRSYQGVIRVTSRTYYLLDTQSFWQKLLD